MDVEGLAPGSWGNSCGKNRVDAARVLTLIVVQYMFKVKVN